MKVSPRRQSLNYTRGNSAARRASRPSVNAAGPGCRMIGDLISTMRPLATAGSVSQPGRSAICRGTTLRPHHEARITSGLRRDHVGRRHDAIARRRGAAQMGEHVLAARDLDQLRDPADAGDHRIVPFLEVDPRPRRSCRRASDVRHPRLERTRQRLGLVAGADQGADGADHGEDPRNVALIEEMDGDAGLGQLAHDVGLQVGEGQHQVGLERQDLVEPRRGEGADPGFRPHLGRPHGVARDADDAVLLAQQIERLDRLLGEADQALGRETAHGAV